MIYKINKQLILENVFIDFFDNLYNKIFNKYKNLSKEEFDLLLNFIEEFFYYNHSIKKFLSNKDKSKYLKLFDKINNMGPLPKKLYRGVAFKTKKEFNKYLNNKNISPDNFTSSWSTDKKVALKFIPGGKFRDRSEYKFGALHTIVPDKNQLFLNINNLFKTKQDKLDFLKLVFKEEQAKNIDHKIEKVILNNDDGSLFSRMHGSVFSTTENEVILKNIKLNEIKTEIK